MQNHRAMYSYHYQSNSCGTVVCTSNFAPGWRRAYADDVAVIHVRQ